MKIILIGNQGMLGRDLQPRLEYAGFNLKGLDIDELDITRSDDITLCFESFGPNIIINCAAYTAVDKAESEPDIAFSINKDGPANLANACEKFNIPLVHLSTDYVFDGNAKRPYREEDPVNPLGVYGRSKWAGEEAVRSCLKKHIIVRTSWLYGVHGHNFVKTVLKIAHDKDEIKVVADQKGCPTWTKDLSDALVNLTERIHNDLSGILWGTYHFCGDGSTTWYEFTQAIVNEVSKRSVIKPLRVIPIMTSEYPTPAKRPMWSVMDCSKIKKIFNIHPEKWKNGLTSMLEEFKEYDMQKQ